MSNALFLPSTSAYEMLTSSDNFSLAWERVRYFDRPGSRDWIGLKVFAANRDYNLEMLRQSLIERTFEPSYPEIKYLPKPSLTLRPMAVLAVSDRIIFQAIANVIAERGRSTLAMVTNRQSFANVLSKRRQKQFFAPWKQQYRLFQEKFCELVEEGNVWLAETDLAAFYETIDHTTLFNRLREGKFLDERSLEHLQAYLPIWSSVRSGTQVARGVPQGCLASDLLANIFLYDLDRELAVQEYYYLRYVDDIRVISKTKDAVQRGLIQIDTTLKSIGLLLQTKKTMVRQITDLGEETDRLAAQLSEIDRRFNEPELPDLPPLDPLLEPSLHDVALLGEDFNAKVDPPKTAPTVQQELLELFGKSKRSIDFDDSDPFAERHLRFCLYRLEPDPGIVVAVLSLFVERPWLSEIIALYLRKCELDKEAIGHLRNVIETHNVYDSVVALAIDILVRQEVSLRPQHDLFRKWLTDGSRDWPLLRVAAIALGESSDNMLVLLETVCSLSPSVRRVAMIQALRLARDQDEATHIFNTCIEDSTPVVIDALLYQLYNEWGLTLDDLELGDRVLSDYCIACAKGYDNTLPAIQPDYIRSVFAKSYNVEFSDTMDFHALLGSDYERASEFLWQAENSYLVNPSRYVSQLDLFHEELLYPILVDKLYWKSTRDELAQVAFPDRVRYFLAHKVGLASFGSAVFKCHHLRSSCPEAHTRLHRQLIATSPITWRQRNGLKKRLGAGYQELADWLLAGCP